MAILPFRPFPRLAFPNADWGRCLPWQWKLNPVLRPALDELEAFLREQVLATYIPVHWLFVDELPKTVSLKVDRPAVIRLFTKEAAA